MEMPRRRTPQENKHLMGRLSNNSKMDGSERELLVDLRWADYRITYTIIILFMYYC